jgi:hypothetical protein
MLFKPTRSQYFSIGSAHVAAHQVALSCWGKCPNSIAIAASPKLLSVDLQNHSFLSVNTVSAYCIPSFRHFIFHLVLTTPVDSIVVAVGFRVDIGWDRSLCTSSNESRNGTDKETQIPCLVYASVCWSSRIDNDTAARCGRSFPSRCVYYRPADTTPSSHFDATAGWATVTG